FGSPVAHEDDPERAVRAALAIREAVQERAESDPSAQLDVRIGVNTGEVVVGDMGSSRIMAYTAIGSNINLGSRLEGKSPVDGVLVSAPVHEHVKGAVESRFAGRITAKGITEEFDTFEILVP
ncbi:MAG TPA: adenylate/guanylate cyclase domain-containing protein, partial [Spirochaetia bacterium]